MIEIVDKKSTSRVLTETLVFEASALSSSEPIPSTMSTEPVTTGDIRGDINTTATLNIGSEVTSAIQGSSDHDWFAITIGVNEIVRFTYDRESVVGVGLGLFDAAGNAVEVEFGQNSDTREIVANNLDAGQYFLGVAGSFCFLQTSSGDYTIEASLISDDYCLLYTSPSPRDRTRSRMPSSA